MVNKRSRRSCRRERERKIYRRYPQVNECPLASAATIMSGRALLLSWRLGLPFFALVCRKSFSSRHSLGLPTNSDENRIFRRFNFRTRSHSIFFVWFTHFCAIKCEHSWNIENSDILIQNVTYLIRPDFLEIFQKVILFLDMKICMYIFACVTTYSCSNRKGDKITRK